VATHAPRHSRGAEGPPWRQWLKIHAPRGTKGRPRWQGPLICAPCDTKILVKVRYTYLQVAAGAPCFAPNAGATCRPSFDVLFMCSLATSAPGVALIRTHQHWSWGRSTSPTTLLPDLPSLAVGAKIGMCLSQSTFLCCGADQSYLSAYVFSFLGVFCIWNLFSCCHRSRSFR
jgi:hypothetical protein